MITIFTPTFNRSNYLKDVYESLKKQTDKDFCWLIVDDGSSDDTKKVVKKFESEKIININYFYQKNSGKHSAINRALDECSTKYILCLDSDDTLTSDAVEKLNKLSKRFTNNIWAIVGPKVDKSYKLSWKWNSENFSVMKFQDIYQKCNYIGETYILMDVEKSRNNKFLIFENENFMPESALYNLLDNDYSVITVDYKLYVCEYLPDGLTKSGFKTFFNNKNGFAYANYINASCNSSNFKNKIKSYSRYLAIKLLFKLKKDKNIYKYNVELNVKIFSIFLFPLYYFRYLFLKRGMN